MNTNVQMLRAIHGHLFGLRKPSILIEIAGSADELKPKMDKLLQKVAEIQEATGFCNLERGKILQWQEKPEGAALARLLVPSPLDLHQENFELIKSLIQTKEMEAPELGAHLKQAGPKSSNTPRLLQAAYELQIPIIPIGPEVYQFGHGSAARWMDSTFTDQTGNVSVRMARDKVWASSILRKAGMPVPQHKLVNSPESAVHEANQIGFPVVIKPANLDGGVGVACNLDNEHEVRFAYEQARQHSEHVLVEKHIEGQDYRLTVLNGALLWAIQRIPAGVSGDGIHTIAELIELCNAEPRRGEGPHAPLKKIVVNDETLQLLAKQSLTLNAIPDAGQFIRLRRAANVATGGMPVKVLEQVHPDNADLAIRAAQVLRLDIAGIDLLIPDISKSWLEQEAAICEVNAQPQIGATTGPHLYAEILKQLLPQKGRIPIVLVVGSQQSAGVFGAIASHLQAKGLNTGTVTGNVFKINSQQLGRGNLFAASQALLRHPKVDCLVVAISDLSVLGMGLVFDRYDHLVIHDLQLDGLPADTPQRTATIKELMATLLPACRKTVINLANSGLAFEGPLRNSDAALIELPVNAAAAIAEITNILDTQ